MGFNCLSANAHIGGQQEKHVAPLEIIVLVFQNEYVEAIIRLIARHNILMQYFFFEHSVQMLQTF